MPRRLPNNAPTATADDALWPEEYVVRAIISGILFLLLSSGVAFADASVAGDWHANVGSGVTINMNVTQDGNWSSETSQNNRVVRRMKGTYQQTPTDHNAGTIVFTPTEASVQQGGDAQPETDQYRLAQNGNQLRLTSGGDTMVFQKRAHH